METRQNTVEMFIETRSQCLESLTEINYVPQFPVITKYDDPSCRDQGKEWE